MDSRNEHHLYNVVFDNVSISYGDERVVRNVEIASGPYTITAIVGESGSGKTILVRAAFGMLPQATMTGRILLNGRDITALPESEWRAIRGRDVSMIFQNPSAYLNPNRRVGDHFRDIFAAHGESFSLDRVYRMLELVHLDNPSRIVEAYPFELSGGMQQRVAIALSLVLEPKILFADEPTSALDVIVEESILSLLRELKDKLGITIVLITHNLKATLRVADYIYVMKNGVVVEEGLMEEIKYGSFEPYTRQLLDAMTKVE